MKCCEWLWLFVFDRCYDKDHWIQRKEFLLHQRLCILEHMDRLDIQHPNYRIDMNILKIFVNQADKELGECDVELAKLSQ
jgi:hypothetical protein